ncbi:MAG: hypothetical protein KGJ23_15800 [Euryarchaeota archaeon]|nr:hypothetical protein [Euryarchaeota archaeon]MDE1838062.1 hypothetical protein [Euryarchaeota archaeon]MDE2046507.1 hypothetical protein [Thermoplasmata archaeon]
MSGRDPEASEPLTTDELQAVLAAADSLVARIRSGRETGSPVVRDPHFLGRVVRVMAYTGCHASVLPELTSKRLRLTRRGGRDLLFLTWRRRKTRRAIRLPVSTKLLPWLPGFLDQVKPRHRSRYNQLLSLVEEETARRGRRIKLNPARFRHTCMVLLHREFGLSLPDVARLAGTTQQTLETYVRRPSDVLAEELQSKGW